MRCLDVREGVLTNMRMTRRRFVWLTLTLLGYGTFAAMVFAGTVRYRTPWDFLLAVLAAIAIVELSERWRERRAPSP